MELGEKMEQRPVGLGQGAFSTQKNKAPAPGAWTDRLVSSGTWEERIFCWMEDGWPGRGDSTHLCEAWPVRSDSCLHHEKILFFRPYRRFQDV